MHESTTEMLGRLKQELETQAKARSGAQLDLADVRHLEDADVLAACESGQFAAIGIGQSRRRAR